MKLGKDFMAEQQIDFMVGDSDKLFKTPAEKDSFKEQIKEFAADRSYKEKYEKITLRDKYGIEMFKYRPNKHLKSKLLTTDISGNTLMMDEKIEATHVAKIIKLPANMDKVEYVEGQLVLLRVSDTVGTDINPEFIFANQFADSNMEIKLRAPIPERTYKFVSRLYDNALLLPEEYNTPADMISTFAIEPFRIVGEYAI